MVESISAVRPALTRYNFAATFRESFIRLVAAERPGPRAFQQVVYSSASYAAEVPLDVLQGGPSDTCALFLALQLWTVEIAGPINTTPGFV